MKAIIDAIDTAIIDALPGEGIKAYGLCNTIKKGSSIQPVTFQDNKQVAINDRWDVNYFHRLLHDNMTSDEEFQFGNFIRKRHNQIVRTVVAIKSIKGDDFIDTFINAIPETLSVPNYKIVNIREQLTKDTDQDKIYVTEWGDGDYEKHRIPYLIYALEYGIDYILC